MNKVKKLSILLLALVLAFSVCSVAALADDPTPPGGYSIMVEARHGDAPGTPVPGMTYRLYKVASIDEAGNVSPRTVAGVTLPARLSGSSDWVTALKDLCMRPELLTQVGVAMTTDANGRLVFNNGLEPAIYLILGESIMIDDVTYTALTAWTQLPVPKGDGWDYNPVVYPKIGEGTKAVRVVIKWEDRAVRLSDGSTWDLSPYRPDEVILQLRKDGDIVETRTVSGGKNVDTWGPFDWDLDEAANWSVTEVRPDGYTVTYDVNVSGTTNNTVITNTPVDPIEMDPPIGKLVVGDGAPSTSRFTFRMEAISEKSTVSPIPMPTQEPGYPKTDPSTGNLFIEKTVTGPGEYEFGTFPLFKAGTYVYELSEVKGSDEVYDYSLNTYTKTVVVTADANGKLSKTETLTAKDQNGNEIQIENPEQRGGEWVATFVNKYTAPGPGPGPGPTPVSLTLSTSKVIKGSPKTTADFEFRLVGKDGAPMPAGTTGSQKTVKIHGQGSTNFGAITFTAPGTYVYEISEVNARLTGYTYDTNTYTVTAIVTEKDGTLSVDVSAVNSSKQSVKWDELVFTNVYKDPAPQTGILWWPVPVLLASGLLLVLLGIVRRRKYEN